MESDWEIVNWDQYFALYENGKLICIAVYKRGAKEVMRRIEELKTQLSEKKTSRFQDEKEATHVE